VFNAKTSCDALCSTNTKNRIVLNNMKSVGSDQPSVGSLFGIPEYDRVVLKNQTAD
jgi:hypothetical protein